MGQGDQKHMEDMTKLLAYSYHFKVGVQHDSDVCSVSCLALEFVLGHSCGANILKLIKSV